MTTNYLILRRAARNTLCGECGRSLLDEPGTCAWDHHRPQARSEADLRAILAAQPGGEGPALAQAEKELRRSSIDDLGPTPDPVPPAWLHELIEIGGITQGEAARRLHVDPTTLRKWVAPITSASHRNCPWAAAELLRRMLIQP